MKYKIYLTAIAGLALSAATALTARHAQADGAPAPADYLGTHQTQIGVFYPPTLNWLVPAASSSGGTRFVPWGSTGDVPVAADYLGLKHAQIAVYRPSTGEW